MEYSSNVKIYWSGWSGSPVPSIDLIVPLTPKPSNCVLGAFVRLLYILFKIINVNNAITNIPVGPVFI